MTKTFLQLTQHDKNWIAALRAEGVPVKAITHRVGCTETAYTMTVRELNELPPPVKAKRR